MRNRWVCKRICFYYAQLSTVTTKLERKLEKSKCGWCRNTGSGARSCWSCFCCALLPIWARCFFYTSFYILLLLVTVFRFFQPFFFWVFFDIKIRNGFAGFCETCTVLALNLWENVEFVRPTSGFSVLFLGFSLNAIFGGVGKMEFLFSSWISKRVAVEFELKPNTTLIMDRMLKLGFLWSH